MLRTVSGAMGREYHKCWSHRLRPSTFQQRPGYAAARSAREHHRQQGQPPSRPTLAKAPPPGAGAARESDPSAITRCGRGGGCAQSSAGGAMPCLSPVGERGVAGVIVVSRS